MADPSGSAIAASVLLQSSDDATTLHVFMKEPVNARPGEAVASDAVADPALAAIAAREEPPRSSHEMAIGELRRLLSAWQLHEPGARRGEDPEALHQLRVTARRIDATLGLFKRQLPRPLVQARKTTKGVLRTLGAARDLDVQLIELAQYCEPLADAERAAAEPLRQRLQSERERARARMMRGLDSEATRRWLETLRAADEERGEHGGEPALAVLPERVRRRFRKLRKAVGKLRNKSSMEEYHQVRRRAKQLRYAIECGAGLFGKPGDETLRALRRLQDRLGAHQDAHMAQSRLALLAADPHSGLPPATLFLMGRLAEQHAQLTSQARATLSRSWRKVRGKRWRALRARLGQLSDSVLTPPATPLPSSLPALQLESASPTSELEARPLKH
jgi:triphosphatase